MAKPHLGAVALGAMAGLAGSLLLFVVIGITRVVNSPSDAIPLIFLQLLGLVGSGYISGRFAGRDHVLHGGYAALLLFVVSSFITLAADPDSASLFVIASTALLALVLGSAGGALARVRDLND